MFSHDQAFKNLIADYMLAALNFLFPTLTQGWPKNVNVTPVRQEQLKRKLRGRFRALDIPLLVKFPGGSREALIVVIETESRERADFLKYLAEVCLHASVLMKTDRVVPAALYPFRSKPFEGWFALNDGKRTYLEFHCLSCVLGTMDARKYEHSRNIVARLCLPLMAHDPRERARLVTRAYEGLLELEPDAGKHDKYAEFVAEYARLDAEETQEMDEKHLKQSPFGEQIMTLKDVLEKRGEARGEASTILSLLREGKLSASDAKAQLQRMARRRGVRKEFARKALREIER